MAGVLTAGLLLLMPPAVATGTFIMLLTSMAVLLHVLQRWHPAEPIWPLPLPLRWSLWGAPLGALWLVVLVQPYDAALALSLLDGTLRALCLTAEVCLAGLAGGWGWRKVRLLPGWRHAGRAGGDAQRG